MTGPDQERLDAALERADEQVEEGCECQDCTLHAGWAEAIRALRDDGHGTPNWHHDGCTGCTAIAKFIKAMLGGGDA